MSPLLSTVDILSAAKKKECRKRGESTVNAEHLTQNGQLNNSQEGGEESRMTDLSRVC